MAHRNKIRGNNLEREIVNQSKEEGLSAKRAYASDGRSLGKSEVVYVLVEDVTIKAKRRASSKRISGRNVTGNIPL